jgi:hypothetical protein
MLDGAIAQHIQMSGQFAVVWMSGYDNTYLTIRNRREREQTDVSRRSGGCNHYDSGLGMSPGRRDTTRARFTATSPTKEWEVELEAGDRMRLEVEITADSPGAANGYVRRVQTGDEVVATDASSGHEEFEGPPTGTYVVSIEVGGSTGEIRLRDMN